MIKKRENNSKGKALQKSSTTENGEVVFQNGNVPENIR